MELRRMLLFNSPNVHSTLVKRHNHTTKTGVRGANSSETDCVGMVLSEMSSQIQTERNSRGLSLFLWENIKSDLSDAFSATFLR